MAEYNTGSIHIENEAPEGHDEAMIALVDGAETATEQPQEPKDDRPAWLPEKFKSPEDMAKAYADLERHLHSKKPEATEEASPETAKPDEVSTEATDQAKEILADAGLDFGEFEAEYIEKGTLSDDAYAKLQAKGIPRAMADRYMAGQQALAAQFQAEIFAEIGGKDRFDQISQWAANNLPKAEVDSFNRLTDTADAPTIKLALAGIQSKFEAANGKAPKHLQGSVSGSTPEVFNDTAEMMRAMSDPRYQTSKAYRDQVERMLENSNIF